MAWRPHRQFRVLHRARLAHSQPHNYSTSRLLWGWRLSLGLPAAPALLIVVGALFLTDTPISLVMRGRVDRARAVLRRVRGPDADVDAELEAIVRAAEAGRRNEEGAFRRLATRREYRPQLVFAVAIPVFFQLTGVIVLAFFAPLMLRTVGFGSNAALMGRPSSAPCTWPPSSCQRWPSTGTGAGCSSSWAAS